MDHNDLEARPNRIPWPPLIYVCAFAVAAGLEYVLPFRRPDVLLALTPMWVGFGLMGIGLAIDLVAMITLRRHGPTILPNAGSKALCTTGVFAFSRNPIYIGNTIALIGLSVVLRWSWLLLTVPGTVTAVAWLAIAREEEHLSRRFGHAFRVYCERVRRWL